MRQLLILMLCLTTISVRAQKISHNFQDISLSDALRYIQEQTTQSEIFFIYNDLEDFRVTANVRSKSVPDAIRQIIGFYPIRVYNNGDREIYVECTHKTDFRLTGIIVDEEGQPVAYANVALLSPQDSTVLSGGVSNESGYFAVPCEQPKVLARISYIGYKTVYRLCDQPDMRTIQLQTETYSLNGIQVNGDRILSKTENGRLTYSIPQLLEFLPADNAYEALTRIPGVLDVEGGLLFAGNTVTLIINGRPTTMNTEQVAERLKQMPATMLDKAEVMAYAPVKYHTRGTTINVITKDFTGTNQLAGQIQGYFRQNKYGYGNAQATVFYQKGKLGVDASYAFGHGDSYERTEHEANHPLRDQRVEINDRTDRLGRSYSHNYHVGIDYAFSKIHYLNVAYTGKWYSEDALNITKGTEETTQKLEIRNCVHNVDASYLTPFGLQVSASYTYYRDPRKQHLNGKFYGYNPKHFTAYNQRIDKWLFCANQTHTLRKGWELNYGAEFQLTDNKDLQRIIGEEDRSLDDLERILDIYAGFSKKITSSLSIDASFAAEHYHTASFGKWHWYPAMNVQWVVNKNNMLGLSFGSMGVFPSYWSNLASTFYTSAYRETWGNPNIKPESVYNVNLTWQLRQCYSFTVFTRYIPDYFVQLAYQPIYRVAVIMQETNLNYSNSYGLQASARFSAGRWLNGAVTATGSYRHDKSDHFYDLPFDRTQLTAVLSSTIAFRLTQQHDIRLILTPTFQSKAIQGAYDIDPMFRLNASLRWTSDNKKWCLTATGQNITNSHVTYHSRLANQDYTLRDWVEYPHVSLTAIYRIGSFKEKKVKDVDTSRMGY